MADGIESTEITDSTDRAGAAGSGSSTDRRPQTAIVVALLIVAAALVYLSTTVTRGWIPPDEGLLGQKASRILEGERPHVDFATPYTGGLGYLHSWTFAVFGERSSNLRWVFFGATSVFVLALLLLLRRQAVGWIPAALLAALAVVVGPFNYFAPMPSWYNLFFGTLGLFFLVRASRDGSSSTRWIALAGLAAGASMLFKITGVYFLGGAALAVAGISVSAASTDAAGRLGRAGSVATITLAALAPLGALGVIGLPSPTQVAGLLLPIAGLCVALILITVRGWRDGRFVDGSQLLRAWVALGAGAAVPLLVYCWPYVRDSQLQSLYEGLFVLPRQRYESAFYPYPGALAALRGLPALLLLLPVVQQRLGRASWVLAGVLIVCGLGGPPLRTYDWFWDWLQFVPAVLIGIGLVELVRGSELDPRKFAVLMVLAMVQMIQVPYATPTYFLYAAPLVLPAAVEAYRSQRHGRVLQIGLALAVAAHSLLWLNRSEPRWVGVKWADRGATYLLLPERLNLWTPVRHQPYERIVELVELHGGESEWILAGPDAPEIYHLSGRRNPKPTFYEIFDPRPLTPQEVRTMVERRDIRVVVVNLAPEFSPQWPDDVLRMLVEVFPQREEVGPMLVMWR